MEFRIRRLPILVFIATSIVVVLLLRNTTVPVFRGVGEGVRSTVTSAQAGLVQRVFVRPHQIVEAGDPLATVEPSDMRVLLNLLQAELQLVQMRFAPTMAEANALDYERVRMEMFRTRADLAVARVHLLRAQNDVDRQQPLHADQLVSEAAFDLSLKSRDALHAEVEERSKALAETERRLERLQSLGDPEALPATEEHRLAVLDRLELAHTSLATNTTLITLYAPISGVVGYIGRQSGEHIAEGEPLFLIHAHQADRIVGYLRQPFPLNPRVGMRVKVTTQAPERRQFWSEIFQVGPQLEVITNALAHLRMGALVDVGLPIVVTLPPQSGVRPGEMVDLVIKPDGSVEEPLPCN